MTLTAAFQNLSRQLRQLYGVLSDLRITIAEDQPQHDEAVLVDRLSDTVDDLLGWLEEALGTATEAQQAAGYPAHVAQAGWALATCQERMNRLVQRWLSEVAAYERMAELMRLGAERQGEWSAWAHTVKEGLDQCRQPIYEVNQALFLGWQEMVERLGAHAGHPTSVAPAASRRPSRAHRVQRAQPE